MSGGGAPAARVLYVVVYPYRLAGANRSLLELVTNLPPAVQPVVAVTGEGPVAEAYRAAGVECHVLPLPGALGRHGGYLARVSAAARLRVALTELVPFTLRLARLIRRWRVSLVHANDARAALVAGPAALLARRPLVMHVRGEMLFRGAVRALSEAVPQRIVAVSAAAAASLSPRARRKTVVVHNGIRAAAAPRRRLPWIEALKAEGAVVAACFASVVPYKGHETLLRAAAALAGRGGAAANVVFLCVGDLPAGYEDYAAALMEEMRALGVRTVTFAGWQDDPASFYRYADLAVLPSLSEGFPRTNLEAMTHALPIVASRLAGVAEQVEHGVNGLLFAPGDAEGLADAVARLAGDAAARRAMGEAGRERVEREFSTDASVRGVAACYAELLGRSVG